MHTLPFFDGHFHLTQMAYFERAVDLKDVNGSIELVESLSEAISDRGVLGFHFVEWESFNGKLLLDEVSSTLPVIVLRTCLHKAWLNQAAIDKFGHLLSHIGEDGSVVENDIWTLLDAFFSDDGFDELVVSVIRKLQAYGVAGGIEMGVSPDVGRRVAGIASRLGFLYFYYLRDDGDPLDCFGDVSCLGIKLFADGSLGAETAYIPQGYVSGSGEGMLLWDEDRLASVISRWHMAGLSVAIHAIGSGAISATVSAFRKVLYRNPAPHRHRIEHLQVLYPGAITDMRELHIVPSIQPTFSHELEWAIKKVPTSLRCGLYRWADFVNEFPLVLVGTDAPVYGFSPVDVLDGLVNEYYWRSVGLEPGNVDFPKALEVMTEHGWRYVGVPISEDYVRAEWREFPTLLKRLIVGGREVWRA